jgi:hypothetical protein
MRPNGFENPQGALLRSPRSMRIADSGLPVISRSVYWAIEARSQRPPARKRTHRPFGTTARRDGLSLFLQLPMTPIEETFRLNEGIQDYAPSGVQIRVCGLEKMLLYIESPPGHCPGSRTHLEKTVLNAGLGRPRLTIAEKTRSQDSGGNYFF